MKFLLLVFKFMGAGILAAVILILVAVFLFR